jgi:hypothetical protein
LGGGAWTGTGITSRAAAAENATNPEARSIGYAENATLPLGPYATFRGQVVDDTAILIAYTRTADANLDGAVNDDDVTIISATYAPGVPQPHWALGDFDYNGFVDDDDVTLLGVFYDPSVPPVPSPRWTDVKARPAATRIVDADDDSLWTTNPWVSRRSKSEPSAHDELIDFLAESHAARSSGPTDNLFGRHSPIRAALL